MSKLKIAISKTENGNMSFRHGERQAVIQNREDFIAQKFANLSLDNFVAMYVVEAHQNIFIEVDEARAGEGMTSLDTAITADSLITGSKGVGLFLLVADCIPLVLYDEEKQILALAHLGWVDTDLQLATKLVKHFQTAYNSNLNDLRVYIGPALQKSSYRYKDPVQKTDRDRYAGWQDFIEDTEDGFTLIGNVDYAVSQLLNAGISKEQIDFSNHVDTATSSEYFSHYLDSKEGIPDKGRFAVAVAID